MTTQRILLNADFRNISGLPSATPFVANTEMDFGYDFTPRKNWLKDLTGKTNLSVMRGILSAGNAAITFSVDETGAQASSDGMGLMLDNLVAAFISHVPTPLAIDGSVKLTAYVVGGYSGKAFPTESQYTGSPGSVPSICNLYDYGSRVNPGYGFALQRSGAAGAGTVAFGGRINSGAINVGGQNISGGDTKKCAIFITFDGANVTVYNVSTGFKQTRTIASLGIASALPVAASIRAGVAFGTTGSTSNAALSPAVYQIAQWGRVLSDTEMLQQYNKTLAAFPGIGL